MTNADRPLREVWGMVDTGVHTLIRTLPLDNGNYGGILQAFALQHAVTPLVDSVATDLSAAPRLPIGRALLSLKQAVISTPMTQMEVTRLVNREQLRFVAEHMHTVRLYSTNRRPRRRDIASYNLFLAGSDQIWRPDYGDVLSYLFDFLPPDAPVRRVAYAASFGVDEPHFPPELLARSKELAQRFDSLSVREKSGVELCARLWEVEAEQVPDPVLLLDRGVYDVLADAAPGHEENRLFAYLLDPNDHKAEAVQTLAAMLGLQPFSIIPPSPGSVREFRRNPAPYTKPPVEYWLRALRDSEFVVTDSFHGCLLAILFNRPFAAFGNAKRGQARFRTLLDAVGLSHHLLAPEANGSFDPAALRDLADDPVAWGQVNAALTEERNRGLAFLSRALIHPLSLGAT